MSNATEGVKQLKSSQLLVGKKKGSCNHLGNISDDVSIHLPLYPAKALLAIYLRECAVVLHKFITLLSKELKTRKAPPVLQGKSVCDVHTQWHTALGNQEEIRC